MTMRNKLLLVLCLLGISGCSSLPVDSPEPQTPEVVEEDTGPVYNSRAVTLFNRANEQRQANPEQAVQLYIDALDNDASMEPALYNLARVYFDAGNQAELVTLAESQTTASARVWNLVGLAYRQQGKFVDAKSAYERALSIDNNHLSSLLNIAVLHDIYLHDLTAALTYYQRYQEALNLAGETNPDLRNWMADLNQRLRGAGQ